MITTGQRLVQAAPGWAWAPRPAGYVGTTTSFWIFARLAAA